MDAGLDGIGPPPSLELRESRAGHRLVLAAEGEIEVASAHALRTALRGAADSGATEVWLDVSRVDFLDSTGVAVLVEARGWFADRRFEVVCPAGPVRRVLTIMGVDRVIAVHPSRP